MSPQQRQMIASDCHCSQFPVVEGDLPLELELQSLLQLHLTGGVWAPQLQWKRACSGVQKPLGQQVLCHHPHRRHL